MQRTALIFKKPYEIELRQEARPVPSDDEVLIKARFSAISAGTEMLVYRGRFPATLPTDEHIEDLVQPFKYPLKYGYASIGRIAEIGKAVDISWLNQEVFCFHPHESHYVVHQDNLIPIPPDIDPAAALLLPSMETAVNLIMDGRPVLGERVVVFGQGVVGLLTTALLANLAPQALIVVDQFPLRRKRSLDLGARLAVAPEVSDLQKELAAVLKSDLAENTADLVFELSGNPKALNQAIKIAGFDSRIVIGSWYGTKTVELDLGARFHRDRIRVISSQVSTIAPEFCGRWTKSRRMSVAWDMIRRINPARLITHRYEIQRAREAYELLDKKPHEAVQVIITYE